MLKTIFILQVLLLVSFANHILWKSDYSQALIDAKNNNKKLMVLLIKDNCKNCKEIVRNIFTNQPYLKKINQKVVSIIVNKDSKINYPIELFYSISFPTLFFINPKDEMFIIEPIYEKITTKDIKNILKDL
jgi:thioredoxin-related protein